MSHLLLGSHFGIWQFVFFCLYWHRDVFHPESPTVVNAGRRLVSRVTPIGWDFRSYLHLVTSYCVSAYPVIYDPLLNVHRDITKKNLGRKQQTSMAEFIASTEIYIYVNSSEKKCWTGHAHKPQTCGKSDKWIFTLIFSRLLLWQKN